MAQHLTLRLASQHELSANFEVTALQHQEVTGQKGLEVNAFPIVQAWDIPPATLCMHRRICKSH